MGMIAHDLRAPVNQLAGFLQLIRMDGSLNEEQKFYAAQMDKTIVRANSLINEFLAFKAMEEQEQLPAEAFAVSELLTRKVQEYLPAAHEKDIALLFYKENKPLWAKANPDALGRVMDNLISNAIKFSEPHTQVSISAEEHQTYIRISVIDQGPGFTDADQQRMFRKFQKLSARPTAGEISTGLGLSIVKVLTEKMNGRVHCQSSPGKGSTFVLELPKFVATA
jgi:signal transduction histidine kinase